MNVLEPGAPLPATVLDVRQDNEYASGHLAAARNVELGALSALRLPGGPVAVMCGHGERAATAASVLERTGHSEVTILDLGPQDWARATGTPIALSP